MRKFFGSKSVMTRILCLLFAVCFTVSTAWAHGPGEGGDIEKTVNIAQWNVGPDGAGVSRVGTDNHVLKLAVSITPEGIEAILASNSITLDIPYDVAHNSGRRILAWTDLSGSNVENITFATTANLLNKKIAITHPVLASGTASAKITMPRELLYDASAHRAATALYLIFGVDAGEDGATDRYTQAGENRGASARNNVNGVNLATEFDIFEKVILSASSIVPCPGDEEVAIAQWQVNGAGVTRTGSGNHVLRMNVNIAQEGIDAILAGDGGTLNIPFTVAHNSQRRVAVWTNLSGAAGEIGDYTFATAANLDSGKVVWTDPALFSGATSASIKIPKALLYNEAERRAATEIYVIFVTDNRNDASTESGNRGASARNNVNGVNLATEFDIFEKLVLSSFVPCSCDGGKWLEETIFTHINLAPGANPSQISFTWFTPRGHSRTALLQIAKVSELVNGQMPANPGQFTAVNSNVNNFYDTNKVTVTGLEPNTAYAYRLGTGSEWSNNIFTFNTQNPDGAYKVIVFGDPQVGSSTTLWENTVRQATRHTPDAAFMISAGDQTNSNSNRDVIGYVTPSQLRSYPVMAVVGNHDNDPNADTEGTYGADIGYLTHLYQWPNDTMRAGRQLGGWDYYFSYGNTLYISINSNEKDVEAHRAFMRQAVASHPNATWKVAVFHHDIYGVGDHAGTGYGDAAAMQADWSPFLDEFGIDVAFNGHDHIYARSKIIKGNEIQRLQMSAIFDQDLNQANPGAVILPNGIQYIALSTAGDKFYDPEAQAWVAYTPGRHGNPSVSPAIPDVPEYTIMTIDGNNLILETFRADTNALTDSITLRKVALREDLAAAIPGAKAIERGDIQEPGWTLFQGAIIAAEAILATGTTEVIHETFTALYRAYFALRVPTNKVPLGSLITQVTNKLATSTEGRWAGQYPVGSKAALKTVLDAAIPVYEKRLATQSATDASFNALSAAFRNFESQVSNIPIPWIFVHEIRATGANQIDLIDWMEDGRSFIVGNETKYFTHHTKQDFASGNFGGPRSEPVFGPANGLGGRGHNNAHITKTNIGEWIWYELNVAQAGSYRVRLGAANKTNTAQTILIRDTNQNTLATFVVPANTPLPASGWGGAQMVSADREIYLPAGKYVIELFFINDGLNVNTRNDLYPDGADIDILTLERTGAGTAPRVIADPTIYRLPMPPLIAAGAPIRQQGWGTAGAVTASDGNEASNLGANRDGIPVYVLKAATHLVLELAAPVSSNMQIQLQSDATMAWNQSEFPASRYWDGSKLVIPMRDLVAYDLWVTMESNARLFVSYYNYGWNELNVMGAYFIVDPAKMPSAAPTPITLAQLEVILDAAARTKQYNLFWRTSVIDLLRTLDLDYRMQARRDLAVYFNYRGTAEAESYERNVWLHDQIIRVLMENGGQVPSELRRRFPAQ